MNIDKIAPNYTDWLDKNVRFNDPYSEDSLKELVFFLLLGKNYRILTEVNTKEKLLATYVWLIEIYDKARAEFGDEWKSRLLEELQCSAKGKGANKELTFWLVGLTHKTAQNLDIKPEEFPDFLEQTVLHCGKIFIKKKSAEIEDRAWLLRMAGAATLSVRGSAKSTVGKILEKVFLKTALTLIGFNLNENFWVNVGGDLEVDRETDAEVKTKRGRIRIDIGLIGQGNPEVISDKVNRVGKNGIVIFDKIGARSNVNEIALRNNVKAIQIRHNQPLLELRRHLEPIVDIKLREIPKNEDGLRALIEKLPKGFFDYKYTKGTI